MEALSVAPQNQDILNDDMYYNIIHGICVSNLAFRIAKELKLNNDECYELAVAGVLHDIGKLKLSEYLYGRNEDTLGIEEMKYMRMHSKFSHEILCKQDYSQFILESVLYHHENYDGTGYPDNLKGDEIPLGARILRVCDVYAALISDRPYRSAFDAETAMELMIDEVKHFDMRVFLAFMGVINTNDNNLIFDI